MKLNCIITDDEPIALEILEDYIRLVPGLNLVAKCGNAMETFAKMREQKIDVLFIDIQMPEITGLDFIKSLKNRPAIIFTTAYPNYAIDGFELDAVDYLLKPISIDRFLRSVDKLFNNTTHNPEAEHDTPSYSPDKKYFFIKSNQELVKLEYNKILFVEGLENYVRIHCEDKAIVSFSTMKNMEDILSSHGFLRIHRSYIVNLDKVDAIQNHAFKIKNKELVIGKSYRKIVAEVLRNYYTA